MGRRQARSLDALLVGLSGALVLLLVLRWQR